MRNKKYIAVMGAVIVTASMLAGVTYAWFTSEKTSAAATITAGALGIDFELDEDEVDYRLYPQETVYKEGIPRPVWVEGTNYPDIAVKTYTLENIYERDVLVRIGAAAILENKITGSEVDKDGYVIYDADGKPTPKILTTPSAVLFYCEVDGVGVESTTVDNNIYIYLPGNGQATVELTVWIDGDSGTNEYQHATISFEGLTAKATQYREAAIKYEFGDVDLSKLSAVNPFE